MREVGYDMLAIAREGLLARAKLNADGFDEAHFLAPLEEIVARGTTAAGAYDHRVSLGLGRLDRTRFSSNTPTEARPPNPRKLQKFSLRHAGRL